MKSRYLCLSLLMAAGGAFAGPDVIIKQRAKELSNQNNVRQGVASPAQTPSQAPSGQTPPPATAQPAALTRLQNDLAAVKPAGAAAQPTANIANDLLALAQGSKPSVGAATRLAESLVATISAKAITGTDRARLAGNLNGLVNSAKFPSTQTDQMVADIQAIFQANGTSRKDAVAVADAAKAVSSEILRGGAR